MITRNMNLPRRPAAFFGSGDWPAPIWKRYRPGRVTVWMALIAVVSAVVANQGRWRNEAAELGLSSVRVVEAAELNPGAGGLLLDPELRPFSGVVLERYPDGALRSRKQVLRGQLEGVTEAWYPGGGLQLREYYAGGKPHGPQRTWYPNGRLLSETPMVRGEPQGVARSWNEDGTLATERWLANREWAAHTLAR